MCIFIGVAVAGYRGDVRQPFKERNLVAESLTGAFAAKLPAGTQLSITDGHCACSVYTGRSTGTSFDADEERRRYQRKGWSPSKVERALASKQAAHERPARERELAEHFVEAIRHLASSGARVTLLAHDFRGGFDEHFESAAAERTPLDAFLEKRGEFPEDTLVTVVA